MIIAAIVIAIIIIAAALNVGIPTLQQQVMPTPKPTPAPAARFSFPSKSSYRTSEGGFLGIGANVVVWVEATRVAQHIHQATAGRAVILVVDRRWDVHDPSRNRARHRPQVPDRKHQDEDQEQEESHKSLDQ